MNKAPLSTFLLKGLVCLAAFSAQSFAAVTVLGTTTTVADNSQPLFSSFSYTSNTSLGYIRDFGNGAGSFFAWTRADTIGTTFYQNDDVSFTKGDVAFPTTFQPIQGETFISTSNGAVFGAENWIAFHDGAGKKGWISFTLSSTGFINTMNYFLYDATKSGGMPLSDAIEYRTGVDPLLAPIPEFSSGLAIGSVCVIGAICRRSRRRLTLA